MQHRPEADAVGAALHGFVRGVAGVQVGEHEHRGATGHLAVRRQLPGHGFVGGGVILQRTVDQQRVLLFMGEQCRFADLLDFLAAGRLTAGIADHRHPRGDAERGRRVGALQGNLGQFAGARVRVHHAVAVDQHFFGKQHEEHRRHQGAARRGLDQLQGRANGIGGGVNDPGHQTVDFIQRQHHGADHYGVFELLLGHGGIEAFAFAQGYHRLDVTLADQVRVEDFQPRRQLDALGAGHGFNVCRFGQ
ncbi:hypothetical protein D3C76_904870 [compost metagenome]